MSAPATSSTICPIWIILNIRGEVHVGELTPNASTSAAAALATQSRLDTESSPHQQMSLLDRYTVGSEVTAVVVSADIHSDKIYLSMNAAKIKGRNARAITGAAVAAQQYEQRCSDAIHVADVGDTAVVVHRHS